MTVFFSSDCHFSHFNIIRYCNRPFSSIADMNDTIIDNFNSVIKPNDFLYHLGDFCIKGSYNYIASLVKRINGRKIFLVGNHDNKKHFARLVEEKLIESYHDVLGIYVNKQYIWLSHYPHRSWNKSAHGSWHCFAHVHTRFDNYSCGLSVDVGVDGHNYFPWSFDQLNEKMDEIKVKLEQIAHGVYI